MRNEAIRLGVAGITVARMRSLAAGHVGSYPEVVSGLPEPERAYWIEIPDVGEIPRQQSSHALGMVAMDHPPRPFRGYMRCAAGL